MVVFQVWDLMVGADNVRAMLGRLIREESLRTYLFTYAHLFMQMETYLLIPINYLTVAS